MTVSRAAAKEISEYEVERDLRTFMDWQEIKKDPQRLKRVRELAKKRHDAAAKASVLLNSNDHDGDE